jgi:hypothetical protein
VIICVVSLFVHDASEIVIISVISVFFIIFKILLTFYIIVNQLVMLLFLFMARYLLIRVCTFIYVT